MMSDSLIKRLAVDISNVKRLAKKDGLDELHQLAQNREDWIVAVLTGQGVDGFSELAFRTECLP